MVLISLASHRRLPAHLDEKFIRLFYPHLSVHSGAGTKQFILSLGMAGEIWIMEYGHGQVLT